jgi:CRISPR type II-A-associated protein Csn2
VKLLHKNYNFIYEFKENTKAVLIVENKLEFRKFAMELLHPNSESGFVLSINNEPVSISDNIACVYDIFNITLNERKVINRLLDVTKKEIISSELLLDSNRIYSELEEFAFKIEQLFDFELEHKIETDVQSLIKFMNIKFREHSEDIIEMIADYMKGCSVLLKINCFIFFNLCLCLSNNEINQLYKYAEYNKINILLIESKQPDKINEFDWRYIIDDNCCEIDLNVL